MVKIGLIADIQYADRGDKGRCLFRSSLDRLKQVVELFNAEGLDLVVQLGDVLDGNPQDEEGLAQSRSELDRVLEVLGELRCPLEHVVGNHCLALPCPGPSYCDVWVYLGPSASWKSKAGASHCSTLSRCPFTTRTSTHRIWKKPTLLSPLGKRRGSHGQWIGTEPWVNTSVSG